MAQIDSPQIIASPDGSASTLAYPTTESANLMPAAGVPDAAPLPTDLYQSGDAPPPSQLAPISQSGRETAFQTPVRGGVGLSEAPAEILTELTMAQDMAKEAQEAYQKELARCEQLETELAGLRQAHEEFQGKHAAEQEAAMKSQAELKGLQERFNQGVTDLEQARAAGAQSERVLKEKEARCGQLETELAGLRLLAGQREQHKQLVESLRETIHQLHASLHNPQ
jgi:DNA repair exonuclease SbcCD ATPase subunit